MASNNSSNKTVVYSYKTPNGVDVLVYNDGTEVIGNQTSSQISYSGTATVSVTDASFTTTSKKGGVITTTLVGNTVVLGNGVQTVTDTSHLDNVIITNNSGDKINGSTATGNNTYLGGNGKDELWAGSGKVYLDGANGSDILHGGSNQTTMVGGNGGDVLYGGTGTDTFLYRYVADSPFSFGAPAPVNSPKGWDIIQNFDHTKDKIDFTVLEDSKLDAGITSQLTGGGPAHLTWRGAQGNDASAGTANPAFAHSVWTDSPDADGHTHFLYVDVNGDGKADIKIQVEDAKFEDLIGVQQNQGPVANDDGPVTTAEDTALDNIVVLANDTDFNGDTLTISGTPTAEHGTVTVNADGTLKYTPDADYNGSDTITYVVTDGFQNSTGHVAVTVTPVNDAPTSENGSTTTDEDTPIVLASLPGADDVDGDSVTYSLGATNTSHGTVTVHADGTFDYTPDANYHGPDSFSFVVDDGNGGTNEYTFDITVTSVNDAPVTGGPASANGTEDDASIGGTVPAATDVDGDALTYALVAGSVKIDGVAAADGTVTFNSDGTYSYAPTAADQALNTGESKVITFDYVANDGTANSAAAPVTITVNGVTDGGGGGGPTDTGGPTGIDFVATQTGNNSVVGHFVQLGDPDASDTFTFAYTATSNNALSASNVSVDAAGNLSVSQSNAGTGDYNLHVTVTDQANNSTSFDFHVLAGQNGNNADVFNGGSGSEIELGYNGDDTLRGGDGRDYLIGGANSDTLVGGAGADVLYGGGNDDKFRYELATDSTHAAFDTIADFTHGTDFIEFKNTLGLTADVGAIGGTGLAANSVGWKVVGGDTIVYANTTNSAVADVTAGSSGVIEIHLTGVTNLATTDIHLSVA